MILSATGRFAKLFCGLLFLVALSPLSAKAQSIWQDRRGDLGGWLDTSTGLVWGRDATSATGRSQNWNGANTYVANLRVTTGNPAWRLPTVNELLDISTKGGYSLLVVANGTRANSIWSSDIPKKQNKSTAYAVLIGDTSGGAYSYNRDSNINALPVYRAFTP